MGLIENSEVYKTFTKNDWNEYKKMTEMIANAAKSYEKIITPDIFLAYYAFSTSESARFYNIIVKFEKKNKIFKRTRKVYFTITSLTEITSDEYLDVINEAKKLSYE